MRYDVEQNQVHEVVRGSRRTDVPHMLKVLIRRAHCCARHNEKGVALDTGLLLQTVLNRHTLSLRASIFRGRRVSSDVCYRVLPRREGLH